MTPKIRRTGLLRRPEQHRDARLYVVATEDTYAAPQYFHALQERGLVDRSRVRVVTLPPEQGRSALVHLLDRLSEYGSGLVGRLAEDEFWAVFDVDHHRDAELAAAVTTASQKEYQLAGSNPCFELWLILHETDDVSALTTYTQDPKAARLCEGELRRVLGGQYNKTRIDTDRLTRASVEAAIARAERLDDPTAPWPTTVGTHVHRLVKQLPPPAF